MACPYFYPRERLDEKQWPNPPRLPLGDPYSGNCCATNGPVFSPDYPTLRDFCNMGYARQACSHFPQLAGPDAVRFLVTAANGADVEIAFVVEKDHRPWQQGVCDSVNPAGEILRAQAEAYLRSYVRRKA